MKLRKSCLSLEHKTKLKFEAEKLFLEWINALKIKLYRISDDYSKITSQSSIPKLVFFFKKDSDLENYVNSGVVEQIKEKYLQLLEQVGYASMYDVSKIEIEFDTHENVKRNFKGNYMYRLT